MSTIRSLKQGLTQVSRLWEEADYDQALAEVERLLEAWPGNPYLHVLKAELVQLQEEPKYDLNVAKESLHQAIDLDKRSPTASIELGHYLDNVEDDPQSAVQAYADGIAAARHLLIDGLIGQAKAYRQLEKKDDFIRCLIEVLHLAQFDSSTNRNKAQDSGNDVIFQSAAGHIYHTQLKGPYKEQIQELLEDLDGDRVAGDSSTPTNGSR